MSKKRLAILLMLLCAVLPLWMLRTVMAAPQAVTRYVTPGGVDSGDCSSAAAPCTTIQYAHDQAVGGDIIQIAAGIYVENVVIGKDITLEGIDAATTIVDGNQTDRAIKIGYSPAVSVTIHGLTLRNGQGGLLTGSGPTLVENCVIRNNSGSGTGLNRDGGGVYGLGPLTVHETSIFSNTSLYGGGVYARTPLTVTRSAIYSNTAGEQGGGIHFGSIEDGRLVVQNSTISGNESATSGGGIYMPASGDVAELVSTAVIFNRSMSTTVGGIGIANNIDVTMTHSVIAHNSGLPGALQCAGTGYVSAGHNLASDGSCQLLAVGDLASSDPLLGPLQDNGGPTWTHALDASSPAVDAGNNATCLSVDQRGWARPFDGDGDDIAVCDIGPYEFGVSDTHYLYLPAVIR